MKAWRDTGNDELADKEDFCEENLVRLGIDKRYENTDMETCFKKITEEIRDGQL